MRPLEHIHCPGAGGRVAVNKQISPKQNCMRSCAYFMPILCLFILWLLVPAYPNGLSPMAYPAYSAYHPHSLPIHCPFLPSCAYHGVSCTYLVPRHRMDTGWAQDGYWRHSLATPLSVDASLTGCFHLEIGCYNHIGLITCCTLCCTRCLHTPGQSWSHSPWQPCLHLVHQLQLCHQMLQSICQIHQTPESREHVSREWHIGNGEKL